MFEQQPVTLCVSQPLAPCKTLVAACKHTSACSDYWHCTCGCRSDTGSTYLPPLFPGFCNHKQVLSGAFCTTGRTRGQQASTIEARHQRLINSAPSSIGKSWWTMQCVDRDGEPVSGEPLLFCYRPLRAAGLHPTLHCPIFGKLADFIRGHQHTSWQPVSKHDVSFAYQLGHAAIGYFSKEINRQQSMQSHFHRYLEPLIVTPFNDFLGMLDKANQNHAA